MVFFRAEERYTSFISSEKDFFKTISSTGKISYEVYDQLNLNTNSYPLSDTIFLIIDKRAYPVKVNFQKIEVFRNTQTKSSEIMKADSTSVSVISGIQENEYKHIQFHYGLNQQEINAFENAKTAAFRYYANPETYTLKLSGQTIHKLKKFFAMQ